MIMSVSYVITNLTVHFCLYSEHAQNTQTTTSMESFIIAYHGTCSFPFSLPPLLHCPTSSPLIESLPLLPFNPLLYAFAINLFPHLTPRDTNTLAQTNLCLYTIHLPPLPSPASLSQLVQLLHTHTHKHTHCSPLLSQTLPHYSPEGVTVSLLSLPLTPL